MPPTGCLTLCRPVPDDAPGWAGPAGAWGCGDDAAAVMLAFYRRPGFAPSKAQAVLDPPLAQSVMGSARQVSA